MSSVPPTVPWYSSLHFLQTPFTEPEWLLEGVLPKGSVILISGREGTMKTWLALDWAYSVAEGNLWLTRTCQAEAVLYLDGENPFQVYRQRVGAIGSSHNWNIWRWQDPSFPISLADPQLLDAAQQHGFIIIDSLRRFMDGLDENSATDMSKITGNLRQLTKWGATVLVIHHSPKDPGNSGYRGSTELGAGVDICMHVKKHSSPPSPEELGITIAKTRYHEDPNIRLEVKKTSERPHFTEIGNPGSTGTQASNTELQELLFIIENLIASSGAPPNQSQIAKEAHQKGLGSRSTILRQLSEGAGQYWNSKTNGKSRVYEPVQVSPSPITGQMNNTNHTQDQPVQESIPSDSGQVDNSKDESQGPVHLSNSLETEQVDNRTIPDGKSDPSIGSNVYFLDHHLNLGQGVIKDIFEWPGLPEEIVYQTEDGTCFPPSCVSLEGDGEII